jgi:two-component system, NarL family, sensor kinase
MPSSGRELEIAIITTTVIVFLLMALILLLMVVVQVRKKKVKVQLEKEILNAQIEIQEQTLKTISQEIHDNIGQVLSLAKLNLNTFPIPTEEDINKKLSDTKMLVSKALNDLRNLSRSFHGDKISELGLKDAIDSELSLLQNTGQYNTSLQIVGEPFILDSKKEIMLFRMIQESLNNCIKHAKAKNIFVQLSNQEDKYIIVISDDGIGFDEAALQSKQKGIGLRNMQNRASLINSLFSIKSTPESGTEIEIILNK